MNNALMVARLPAGIDSRGDYERGLHARIEERRAFAIKQLEDVERETRRTTSSLASRICMDDNKSHRRDRDRMYAEMQRLMAAGVIAG